MKLSKIFTAPNQLTLLRMAFVPFIVIELVDGRYFWALVLFVVAGFSDGLDGLLARKLHQQTLLGQYLDPIADKLLLSTMFPVLSILHKIPWKFTVLVFSRDISILAASAVLFAISGLRDFRPSIFGKANTFSQIAAVFFASEPLVGLDLLPGEFDVVIIELDKRDVGILGGKVLALAGTAGVHDRRIGPLDRLRRQRAVLHLIIFAVVVEIILQRP